MSPTVHEIVTSEHKAVGAAHKIIDIFETLNTKEQIYALALVNTSMGHHREKASRAYDQHAVMEAMKK